MNLPIFNASKQNIEWRIYIINAVKRKFERFLIEKPGIVKC